MRCIHTGDEVTDTNLAWLESMSPPFPGVTAQTHADRLVAANRAVNMLPGVIKAHFQLPSHLIGGAADRWDVAKLLREDQQLCEAIDAGLQAVEATISTRNLTHDSLTDRPRSRGEDFLVLLENFKQSRSMADLARMQALSKGGRLDRALRKLGDALRRVRPQKPFSREEDILRAIDGVEAYAPDLHGFPTKDANAR